MQTAAQNTEAHTLVAATANGMAPPLTQPSKHGHKHVGIPAQSAPLPSSAPPPSASAPIAWYTAHALPGMQATVHNAAAPALSAATNLPLQTLEWHHVHTDTLSAPWPPSTVGDKQSHQI